MQCAPPSSYCTASAAGSAMSASGPRLGLARLTSAITQTSSSDRIAATSRAGGTLAARPFSSSSGTSAMRAATSSRTPATMSSSTLTRHRVPRAGAWHSGGLADQPVRRRLEA